MPGDYQKLLFQVSQLERRLNSMFKQGTIDEVKGDKIRVNMGGDEKTLSPWIHTSNFRGEMRERLPFNPPKEQGQQGGQGGQGGGSSGGSGAGGGAGGAGGGQGGKGKNEGGGQNVWVFSPSGDFRQAVIMPYGPNKNNKAPAHANKSGRGEQVSQLEDYRNSIGKDGQDTWLEKEEEEKDQGGGGGGGGQQGKDDDKERKTGGDKAKMKRRMNEKGGITDRVGKDARMQVHEKGVKIKAKKEGIVLADAKDETIKVKSKQPPWVDKPWIIKDFKDPIDDDDK
jgi:hypothetical protein